MLQIGRCHITLSSVREKSAPAMRPFVEIFDRLLPVAFVVQTEESEFGVGDVSANCPRRCCHVSKFKAPFCLHCNAVKSVPTQKL